MISAPHQIESSTFVPAWVWGPAGRDTQLARAISDLTTGGYLGSTRELLATVRESYDRRAYCTSVLVAVLVRRRLDLAELWLRDEPQNPDAVLLHARVLVVRAIHASRGEQAHAQALAVRAVQACQDAGLADVGDPTPSVALLHLGEAGMDLPELRRGLRAVGNASGYGPWRVLDEILRRAPDHREALHRVLPQCRAYSATPPWSPDAPTEAQRQVEDARARAQVAVWAADEAYTGSPLKLLRLMHAADQDPFPDRAEQMRMRNHVHTHREGSRERYLQERIPAMQERWRLALRATAVKLARTWFGDGAEPPYMPLSDLSFLAGFLHRAGEPRAARLVLEWMVPYATAEPWRSGGRPGDRLGDGVPGVPRGPDVPAALDQLCGFVA